MNIKKTLLIAFAMICLGAVATSASAHGHGGHHGGYYGGHHGNYIYNYSVPYPYDYNYYTYPIVPLDTGIYLNFGGGW